MILPAILYKDQIEHEFKRHYYTDEMMYYNGYIDNSYPTVSENPNESTFQWAVVNDNGNLIGYISYYVDWYSKSATRFGIFSFEKGNVLMGKAVIQVLNDLLYKYKMHRISWLMVSGNPVEDSYDRFCEKHHGCKYILRDVFKDRLGEYHNSCQYEIIQEENK